MAPSQAQAQKRPTATQLAKIDDFAIPADEEEWHELVARKPGLKKQTIHTIPADWLLSASEATNSQYAMLRTYSPGATTIYAFQEECDQFGFTNQVLDTAAALLGASTEWCRYIQIIESDDSIDNILATSDRIHDRDRMQGMIAEVGSTTGRARPQRIPELPDAEDEATVNAATIILLQAISQLAHSNLEWVMNRAHFVCEFKNSKFNTYTDGALRSKSTTNIFAIVEVKKTVRRSEKPSIFVQEACELAGWLMHSSAQMAHFNAHFMLISQDRHQLFVTFVPFDKTYEDYLRIGTNTDAFLVMNTYGPFRTTDPRDMMEFGRIILAAILIVKPVS
ncbi:hypothetical protein LT330_007982 [Penicillium expansum]|nr:hypothetical protein LT330_007982 [Penicillium expansum]